MTKHTKQPSPASISKKIEAERKQRQAEKLRRIQDAAFARGQRMALRAAAKRAGFEAGVEAAQKQASASKPSKATARGKRR